MGDCDFTNSLHCLVYIHVNTYTAFYYVVYVVLELLCVQILYNMVPYVYHVVCVELALISANIFEKFDLSLLYISLG